MTEMKKKRSSFAKEGKMFETDIILDIISIIMKREDSDKCICSNKIPEPDNKTVFHENEIVPMIEVPLTSDNRIKISDIISKLKLLGYPLCGAMICMYLKLADDYVYVGSDPLDGNIILDPVEMSLKLMRMKAVCYIEEKHLARFQQNVNIPGGKLSISHCESTVSKKKDKRTKERKIGYIIEKVNAWRKLYNGFYNELGEHTRYSLDQAAKMIGISKKSLDDYLLQLRLGRKYGFDFNGNKGNKVGVLRSFVKKHRNPKGTGNSEK